MNSIDLFQLDTEEYNQLYEKMKSHNVNLIYHNFQVYPLYVWTWVVAVWSIAVVLDIAAIIGVWCVSKVYHC